MNILEHVRAWEGQMIRDRRWLHEHPELSGQEKMTLDYVVSVLRTLGVRIHIVPNGGVIGVLGNPQEKPCVLLRADVDALEIREKAVNLNQARSCVSQNDGVMHACGHDAHTAMLLCAARVLKELKHDLPGCVLFVFEQGEEKGGKGFLENLLPYIDRNFQVDTCYATHVRWDIPAGRIAVPKGTAMAGGFGFDVRLKGRGGHGSRPDLAISPIDCFAAIHQQLCGLRMRAAEPESVLTYSLGIVQAGEQSNTIPEALRFCGTVRTFDTAGAGERFAREMKNTIDCISKAYGCAYELVHFSKPLYETKSDPQEASRAQSVIAGVLGEEVLIDCKPWMASESMSAYLKLWPGAFTFTGIRNEELGCGANHHTPEFDLDESGMIYGAAAACAYAMDCMINRPEENFVRAIVSMEDLVSRSI